jgi:tetratricopeptide (TPR) repeat protein
MESLEIIDDYFKGLLTDEQKMKFEQRILSDSAFAEEVAFYVSAGHLLKAELELEKKVRFRDLYEQSKATVNPRSRLREMGSLRRIGVFAAAAAVLIVALGLWWLSARQSSPEKLADRYIKEQLLDLPVKMSSQQDSLQTAIGDYNQGRLPEALALFEQILRQDPGASPARIYAGIVYLRLTQYDKALYCFQQLEADTALYSNPALFYESLTLMKRNHPGDAPKARKLLEQVVDRSLGKKEDARELLGQW